MRPRPGRVFWPVALLLLLAGCSGELQAPGEALRIFDAGLPEAYLGEPYEAPIRAAGGLRPFDFRLSRGQLPPGLALENGVLRGVPQETGAFGFTVSVSDANLSTTFEDFELRVGELPPPRLVVSGPETELREATTLRVSVEEARGLRAQRTEYRWDPELFALVEGSVAAASGRVGLVWEAEPGRLQVDAAALGQPWQGREQLYRFALLPRAPSRLALGRVTELVGDDGRRFYERSGQSEEAPAAEGAPAPAAGAEDEGAGGVAPPAEDAGDATYGDEPEDPGDEP